jgi:hypothetical protein
LIGEQADLKDMFRIVLSLVMQTPENKEEDTDDTEHADGRDIQMEYSSD